MNILLIAATRAEIAPLISFMEGNWKREDELIFSNASQKLSILVTGVGMVATTFALTKQLQTSSYDLVLQAGIGGSYDHNIPLGEVVQVTSDQFGDLGAEDHYNFLDVFDLGLEEPGGHPFNNKQLTSPAIPSIDQTSILKVSGITINTVAGSSFTVESRIKKYGAQTESMEGAAFHYVCLKENIPFAQIRAISNYVEPRDRAAWKIKEAVEALNGWLIEWLTGLLD
jgi:futalosine hydrolase